METLQAQPPSELYLFSILPKEIRLSIWEQAGKEPRAIELEAGESEIGTKNNPLTQIW